MRRIVAALAGLALTAGLGLTAGAALAETKTFRLSNPFPFPLQIRILGDAPQFPQVMTMPGAPASPPPIPYPSTNMRVQLKMPNGQWSPTQVLPWRSGRITLPKLF